MIAIPQVRHRHPQTDLTAASVPPLMRRILAARGIIDERQLSLSLKDLPKVQLPDEQPAVELLLQALERQQRIVIVGDYDADGATSTALLWRALNAFGFTQVSYFVPDRFVYGYGLSPAIVEEVQSADLIITVDNGIASVAGVAAAQALGIKVLVTDHHLPGEKLPAADALVNPRLSEDSTGHNLAGVGVVFYLLLALRRRLREMQNPVAQVNVADWLDLVALGTVADVVKLDQVNRILVEQGLRRIRAGAAVAGIQALLEVSGRQADKLVSQDLGFALGPRLNAAGRLSDMELGIRCLLTDDRQEALTIAQELQRINQERRHIQENMQFSAAEQVARWRQKTLPTVVCLYEDDWHEGVVGIVASRVKEELHRPVFAFAQAQEKGFLKGSGRSIPGLHLKDVLERVASLHPNVMQAFGGHAMAAGLTLPAEHYELFTQAVAEAALELSTPELFQPVVYTDGTLQEAEIALPMAEQLRFAFPWGAGFEAPLFDGEFEVVNSRVVGEKHLKLTVGLPSRSAVVDGIYFNPPEVLLNLRCHSVYGVYQLDVNEWRGRRQVQLLFQHVKPL